MDAGWVASAPRYPASKKLVVNLPAVETGSVIRVTTVTAVTNSPIAYCNLFAFDSTEPIGVQEVVVEGVPMKVAWAGALTNISETSRFSFAVTNPVALRPSRRRIWTYTVTCFWAHSPMRGRTVRMPPPPKRMRWPMVWMVRRPRSRPCATGFTGTCVWPGRAFSRCRLRRRSSRRIARFRMATRRRRIG